MGRRKVRI